MQNFAFISGNQRISITGFSWNYILHTATLLTCLITIHKTMKSKNEYLYKGKKLYLKCFHDPVKALTYWASTYKIFLIYKYWYVKNITQTWISNYHTKKVTRVVLRLNIVLTVQWLVPTNQLQNLTIVS